MLAQSQASVPPAPAWMSTKQFSGSARVVEHASELEPLDLGRHFGGLAFDGDEAGGVAVFARHLEQLGVVGELAGEPVEHMHDVFKRFFFAAQVLGALGVVPDRRVFESGLDFLQLRCFGIVVKDTSGARPRGWSGLRAGFGWCCCVRLPWGCFLLSVFKDSDFLTGRRAPPRVRPRQSASWCRP